MKSFLLTLTLLCSTLVLMAQPLRESTFATKIKLAEQALAVNDYYNAIEQYSESYDEVKDYDVAVKVADLNYELRDYRKASTWYNKALRRDKEDKYKEYRFKYARALKMQGEYQEAIVEFERYIESGDNPAWVELSKREILGSQMALEGSGEPEGTVSNAGRDVNTKNSEYRAVLAPGGGSMYYSSFNTDDIIVKEKSDNAFAKILRSTRSDKGWGEGEELGENINRPGVHTSNPAISNDGRRMLFTRSVLNGHEIEDSRIYMSEGGNGSWGPANEVDGVNGDYLVSHPAFGELFGNEVMFFSSNKEGGEGGWDIYYAAHKGGGVYGEPVNLGSKINTIGDEVTPFYRDGILYFSTTGHPTIGGFDIYSTNWDGATWSDPANMGMTFNSMVDDKAFTLDEEGTSGFLISNREGGRSVKSKTCCNDIYNVSLKVIVADLMVTVFDSETKEPLGGATVQLIEMTDDTAGKTEMETNQNGNDFAFPLELDKAYMIIAKVDNYFPDTLEFNTAGLMDSRTFQESLSLVPEPVYRTISREEPIELGNVLYDFAKATIQPSSYGDLDFLANLMNQYPDMVVQLRAHTDSRGRDAANRELSQRRAESAKDYLIGKGIARNRIRTTGYGETDPRKVSAKVAAAFPYLPEGTVLTEDFINALGTKDMQEQAHQLNRRTEFAIVSGPTSIKIEETELIQIGNRKVEGSIKPAPDKQSMPTGSIQDGKIHKMSSLYGKKDLRGVPILQFDRREVNFGKVKKGDKARTSYTFTNVGDTPATIELVSACDCTTAEYERGKTYQPGESGTLTVIFNSAEKDESETIDVDLILVEVEPDTENPIIERVVYHYELVK